ncbi:MAG: hypothetical protein KDJ75_05980 [Alphaproteobacteria bacterium]|nr:hypothetical protein [Alphaproteobacteria bacterium]
MNEEERRFIYACLEDVIDGHWKVVQALLRIQRCVAPPPPSDGDTPA